jgi:hypothetical protein
MEVNNSNNSNNSNQIKEGTTTSNSSSNNNNNNGNNNSISKVPLRTRILQIFLSFSSVSEPLDPKVLFSELYYDYRPSEVFKVLNELVDEGIIAYKPDGMFVILSMSLPKVIKEILGLERILSAKFLFNTICAYKLFIRKGIEFEIQPKLIWQFINEIHTARERKNSIYELRKKKILIGNKLNLETLNLILGYLNILKVS